MLKKIALPPMKASKLFVACCILHNILQQHGEHEFDEVVDEMNTGDGKKKRKLLASYLQQL